MKNVIQLSRAEAPSMRQYSARKLPFFPNIEHERKLFRTLFPPPHAPGPNFVNL